MSADNYYVIKKHGNEFAAYHCFASDYSEDFSTPAYTADNLEMVHRWATKQYAEYGVEILDECWD